MSVVIIGGNECMERQYTNLCKKHGMKAKVFCKPCGDVNYPPTKVSGLVTPR